MSTTNPASIGMIGAGRVAQAIAREAVPAGYEVVLSNSRGPGSLSDLVSDLGGRARAGTVHDAVQADIVILAVGWDQVLASIEGETDWAGKIVVDTTNQWHHHDPRRPADLGDETGSEHIAAMLPGARVVKAFNTVYAGAITRTIQLGTGPLVIFLAGDDVDAKHAVASFVGTIGLLPIDLGGLRDGGRLMQYAGPLNSLELTRFILS